ncbi:MAG: hypothetical protein AAF651_03770 [Cyanobacteria bacterium P01_C01_bin.73]
MQDQDYESRFPTPHYPIDCPHCNRRFVVRLNSTTYACLNCRHRFELNRPPFPVFLAVIIGFILFIALSSLST